MKQALLIIDVQNFFINKWTQSVPKNIVKLIQANDFTYIIFTKFVNTPDSHFVKQFNYTECTKPPYTDIVADLLPWVKKENVFTKNTYSSFYDTKFTNYLKMKKIDKLVIAGIDTENCVLTNARAAFDNGYKVTVVADCCGSSTGGPDMHQVALEIIKNNIGEVI